jgi:prepilin-type N-terminal cleavage/methylation domain-containing protein/prepilin-type processing-associated H-X9-DG protein
MRSTRQNQNPIGGRGGSRAFTLIELLVVIAIISILAAILFPVFAAAREKSRQAACTSNLKQLGLAIMQYTQDYDEFYPCGATQAGTSNGGMGWASEVFPYVKSLAVFTCPDDNFKNLIGPSFILCSYGYNQHLDSGPGAGNPPGIISLKSLNAPSNTVCLFEVTGDYVSISGGAITPNEILSASGIGYNNGAINGINTALGGGYTTGNMGTPFTAAAPVKPPRHTSGSNWMAADGHVKWLRGEFVSNGIDPASSTSTSGTNVAAGTDSMASPTGSLFTMTFSNL